MNLEEIRHVVTDVFLDMCALLESCYTLPVLKKKYRMRIG